jgi:hypothetical protein
MQRPVVHVIGAMSGNLVPGWGPALRAVRYTDNEGADADEIEIEFSVDGPGASRPASGTSYRLLYGWDEAGLRDAGSFTVQSSSLSYAPDDGWTLTVVARSADFLDADKAGETAHFDDETVGEMMQRLAGSAGKSARVHPELADIKIPYRLNWGQSPLGFAQALADEIGGSLKPANGQWQITKKNSGQTAGGTPLPPLIIPLERVTGCEITEEERPKFGEAQQPWFDPEAGLSQLASAAGIGKAAQALLLHPAASAVEAAASAAAAVLDLGRSSVSGSVTAIGDPDAMAGAPVILPGYGGAAAVATSITHEFTFDEGGGWLMTVELAAQT